MTSHLREELERIAADAPVLHPGTDIDASELWARGRRRHRLDLLASVASVVLVLGLVGSLVAWWPGGDDRVQPAEPDGERGHLPSVIHDVPAWLTERDAEGRLPRPLERDLALGRASVAYVAEFGVPVVVTASDGEHHLVDLPGSAIQAYNAGGGYGTSNQSVALSPDGTRLAYAFSTGAPDQQNSAVTAPGGVRVVDLRTGDVEEFAAEDRPGPSRVVWDPSGEFVAWEPSPSQIAVTPADGVRSVTLSPSQVFNPTDLSQEPGALSGVSRSGDPLVMSKRGDLQLAGEFLGTVPVKGRHGGSPAVQSPEGLLAIGSEINSRHLLVLDPSDRRLLRRTLPSDVYPHGAAVTPLGWTPDGLLLARVEERRVGTRPLGSYVEGSHLALMTPPDRPESEWTYRIIVREMPEAVNLTVATDLVTLAEPTRDFPAPDWPFSWNHAWGVWAPRLALPALAVVLLVIELIRRRKARRLAGNEPHEGRPTAVVGNTWPAALVAAVVTFALTVLTPPLGFLVGVAALAALALRRALPPPLTAAAAGAVVAVACYLAVWLVGSLVDPAAPDRGSGSSAAEAVDAGSAAGGDPAGHARPHRPAIRGGWSAAAATGDRSSATTTA